MGKTNSNMSTSSRLDIASRIHVLATCIILIETGVTQSAKGQGGYVSQPTPAVVTSTRGGEYNFEEPLSPETPAQKHPYAGSYTFIGPEIFGVGYYHSIWDFVVTPELTITGAIHPLKFAKGPTYKLTGKRSGRIDSAGFARLSFEVRNSKNELVAIGRLFPEDRSQDWQITRFRNNSLAFPLEFAFQDSTAIDPQNGRRENLDGSILKRRADGFSEQMLIHGYTPETLDRLVLMTEMTKLKEASEFLNSEGFVRTGSVTWGNRSDENQIEPNDLIRPICIETNVADFWDDIVALRKSGFFVSVEGDEIEKGGPSGASVEDKLVIDSNLVVGDSGRIESQRVRLLLEQALTKIIETQKAQGKIVIRDIQVQAKAVTIRLQGPEAILADGNNKKIDDLEFRCVILQDADDPPMRHRLFFSYVTGKWADAPIGGGTPKDGWFESDINNAVCRKASEKLVIALAKELKGRAIIGEDESFPLSGYAPYPSPYYQTNQLGVGGPSPIPLPSQSQMPTGNPNQILNVNDDSLEGKK